MVSSYLTTDNGSLIVGGEGVGLIKLPPIANPVAFLRDLEGAASVGRRRVGPGAHLRAIPAEREYSESLGRRVRRAAS